jgi:hypothetical protein
MRMANRVRCRKPKAESYRFNSAGQLTATLIGAWAVSMRVFTRNRLMRRCGVVHLRTGARRFSSEKKCSTTETPSGAAFVGSLRTNRKREPSGVTSEG